MRKSRQPRAKKANLLTLYVPHGMTQENLYVPRQATTHVESVASLEIKKATSQLLKNFCEVLRSIAKLTKTTTIKYKFITYAIICLSLVRLLVFFDYFLAIIFQW